MSLNARLRGWIGEVRTSLAHRLFLDHKTYIAIHNATIITARGTTQIDHIIVSRYGIFVIETKNRTGLIRGNEADREWTQILRSRSFRFQNPLRQNYQHVRALVELLGIEEHEIIPVIVFWGNCRLEGSMSPNVRRNGYTDFIKQHKRAIFADDEVQRMAATISKWMQPRTGRTHRDHVRQVTERFASTTICPRCGGTLRLRTARSGRRAGSQFLGCSRYPTCRYTKQT